MGYKCTPQMIGLVRGEPKPGAKHRANGLAISEESGNERYSKSETLDRSRSKDNEYVGFKSGKKCWEAMEADAAEYRVRGKTKDGKKFERGLRADAVIGYACIFNPPADMTVGWTEDDYLRFYDDSFDVMAEIEPRLFREENVRMIARHRDEGIKDKNGEYGEHVHFIADAKDAEGRYCGNIIDAAFFVRVNENYPKLMREKGWDLEDLDLTDFKRMGKDENGKDKDPEYKAERKAKQKKSGRSTNRYAADMAMEEAISILEDLDVERYLARMEIEDDRIEAALDIREAKEAAQKEAALMMAQAEQKEQMVDRYESEVDKWAESQKREIARQKRGIARKNQELSDKVTEMDGLILEAQHFVDELEKDTRNRKVIQSKQEKVDAFKQRNNSVKAVMMLNDEMEEKARRQQSADLSL